MHRRHPAALLSSFRLAALLLVLPWLGCGPSKPSGESASRISDAMNRGVTAMGQYLYDDAVQAFEEAVRLEPNLTEAHVNLAIARFNRNRKEDLEAVPQMLAELLRRDPAHLRALYFQAIVLQHLGKTEEAVAALEAVVRARPEDGAVWYLLGLCKQRLDRPADEEFRRAIRLRPYLYSAYYQLYRSTVRAGNERAAAEYLEQFKRLRESPLGETIELPQYNQMGELALVVPMPRQQSPPLTPATYGPGSPVVIADVPQPSTPPTVSTRPSLGAAAIADFDRDGRLDLLLAGVGTTGRPGSPIPILYTQTKAGSWTAAPTALGPAPSDPPAAAALGDFDHDDVTDVFLAGPTGIRLFHGSTNGAFTEVTREAGLLPGTGTARSGLWLDADHDGDLDLFVCYTGGPNQLFQNDGSGVFTNIAASAGVNCPEGDSTIVIPGDFDGDRDLDLLIARDGKPARLFLNDLLGHYREADLEGVQIRAERGAAAQDLDGDGIPDLLTLGGELAEPKLFAGDGHGHFRPVPSFDEPARAAASWGPLNGFRLIDLDLDGDLDVACFGTAGHVLLNDGSGRFVLRSNVWSLPPNHAFTGVELADLDGDLIPDLLLGERGPSSFRLTAVPGKMTPPPTALAIQPTGIRSRDGRTRSPGSGFGVTLTARTGLREHRYFYSGQSGGPNQSLTPALLGLAGAPRADYVAFAWPDGVAQVESAMAAGQVHRIAELERKISSCPVLFAWNGKRFEFVTDFAGVGGLGYFASPGVSAPPQILEHVKIEPSQLTPRNGAYELRVTEPMEESAYLDRLELLAIDHPRGWQVFPDERLAITGAQPTHELLVVDRPIFPRQAFGPDPKHDDRSTALRSVDRTYAYDPPLDRRFIGFCRPHTLELDFGDELAAFRTGDRAFLFIQGFIEYPYSQTVFAASQSRVGWEPIRVEGQTPDGTWHTLVPDAGVPGGMGRMMTVDLTGHLPPGTRRLRLTTNLEVCYDQIFVARPRGLEAVTVQSVPLREATLRRVGFAREYSPDGRQPPIYDYDRMDATAPFHVLRGEYTRYGAVAELLADFDDRYVIMGPGDEMALRYDAAATPPVPEGHERSFVLVSHAYCKDMDLYTATPRTLEPLPFRGMSRYPYPTTEQYPRTPANQAFLQTYNTRHLD